MCRQGRVVFPDWAKPIISARHHLHLPFILILVFYLKLINHTKFVNEKALILYNCHLLKHNITIN